MLKSMKSMSVINHINVDLFSQLVSAESRSLLTYNDQYFSMRQSTFAHDRCHFYLPLPWLLVPRAAAEIKRKRLKKQLRPDSEFQQHLSGLM